jgi:hypothetical protein
MNTGDDIPEAVSASNSEHSESPDDRRTTLVVEHIRVCTALHRLKGRATELEAALIALKNCGASKTSRPQRESDSWALPPPYQASNP